MNEAHMIQAICKTWKKHQSKLWLMKIPDYFRPYANYSNNRAVDTLVCYNGYFLGIEWKIINTKKAEHIKINKVRESQISALEAIEEAGGIGLVVIGVYHDPQHKHFYVFSIEDWKYAATRPFLQGIDLDADYFGKRSSSGIKWDWQWLEEVIDNEIRIREGMDR